MFEFKKMCNDMEKLNRAERGLLLAEKSVSVVRGLRDMNLPIDPIETLVSFIIGSVVSDDSINEKDYLYIYPSLVKSFGNDFDFAAVKHAFQVSKDIKKEISRHTEDLLSVISECDEDLAADIIVLCLLITSIDGKVSLKEKRYVRRLCRA